MKTLHLVSGLPRSGSMLITNILKQNPDVHGNCVSSLSNVLGLLQSNWDNILENRIVYNEQAKKDVLKSIVDSYYSNIKQNTIFDRSLTWVSKLPLLESILQTEVKMLCMVRNPAEIISSYEKIKRLNPVVSMPADIIGAQTVNDRAFYYSSPDGILGKSHTALKDAMTVGILDKLLFVDYNKFCGNPKGQLKRIYEFFNLPAFEHNLINIQQTETYDTITCVPDLYKIRPVLQKTTVNCVEYIGLDLYKQFNRDIFWDAFV